MKTNSSYGNRGQTLALSRRCAGRLPGVLVTLALITAVTAQAAVCVPAPAGLVGWWRGEANALDQAGTNNGAPAGNTTFGPGRVGQGFVFDGSGDGVSVGNPAGLKLQDFTIEAWIKRSSLSAVSLTPWGGEIFCCTWGGYAFGFYDDGRLVLSKVGYSEVDSSLVVTDTNTFHHVAVTKEGSTVVFYLDGVGETVGPYDPGFVFSGSAAIGARGSDLVGSFLGGIDEVSVYNRALAASEIQAIYTASSAGKCPISCIPHAAKATATVVNGFVVAINIASSGCGYTNAPLVEIRGGGGSGATATATISNGSVTGITITDAGIGYTSTPKVVIASPPFMPWLGIAVSKVKVTQHLVLGRNYVFESSNDLSQWNQIGPPFTAQDEEITQEFDVDVTGRFFRIREVP